jgi:REP element-mobilizing transposase RayT
VCQDSVETVPGAARCLESRLNRPKLERVARPPRLLVAGIHHLTTHGSDKRFLFLSDEDREDFLERLALICERFELALLSYVLLGNHYHALLRIPDARLSRALQRLHTEYSRHHNRRQRRSAHLFRAHPYTGEIGSDEQLVAACRYLARNPVEAGLADDPLDWPWSSARAHAGLERPRFRWPRKICAQPSARTTTGAVATASRSVRRKKADARTRTGDPFITSEVLYQLSYVGETPTVAVSGASNPRRACR